MKPVHRIKGSRTTQSIIPQQVPLLVQREDPGSICLDKFGTFGSDGESVEKRNDRIGAVIQTKCPKQTTGTGGAERTRRSSGILYVSTDVSLPSKRNQAGRRTSKNIHCFSVYLQQHLLEFPILFFCPLDVALTEIRPMLLEEPPI